MKIEQVGWSITLGGDWLRMPGDDPEQFTFTSASLKSTRVLSVMTGMGIPKDRLLAAAQFMLKRRTTREIELNGQLKRSITLGDQWAKLDSHGDVAEIAYAYADDKDNLVRFNGYVSQDKVINFWVSTTTPDNEVAKRIFMEARKGFQFYVP